VNKLLWLTQIDRYNQGEKKYGKYSSMKEETKLCRITSPPVFVSKKSQAVLLIRIRIHMFWGLLDPDPLVITYKYRSGSGSGSSSKINKKNLDFYCFVTSL
jgi:hypothetical protein